MNATAPEPVTLAIDATVGLFCLALMHLMKVKFPTIENNYANYMPVFLIDQMIAVCEFENIPYQMTPELIDRAWGNMFVRQEEISH